MERQAMNATPMLGFIPIIGELTATGMLPILFAVLERESLAVYGLQRRGLGKSLLMSAVVLAVFAGAVHLGIERATPVDFADLQVRSMWRLLGGNLANARYDRQVTGAS
jgi:hypothetical protein